MSTDGDTGWAGNRFTLQNAKRPLESEVPDPTGEERVQSRRLFQCWSKEPLVPWKPPPTAWLAISSVPQ